MRVAYSVAMTVVALLVCYTAWQSSFNTDQSEPIPKWRASIPCEPCEPCDLVQVKDPMPCYHLPCKAVPCNPVPCMAQKCKAVPCEPKPCTAVPCEPKLCTPVPCAPQPCEVQACEPQLCQAAPCIAQPCDASQCPACSPCPECRSCPEKLAPSGTQLPHQYGGELFMTKPDLVAHGVTFRGDKVGLIADRQMQIIAKLPEAGDLSIPHGSSCAVVGGSGRLINSRLGDQIDKHDVIMRMGAIHYSEDSGSRTTHYLFYPQHLETPPHSNQGDGDVIWILSPFKTSDWSWLDKQLKKGKQPRAQLQTDSSKFRIMSSEWMRFVWEVYFPRRMQETDTRWQWPTQGMFSILFLLYSGRCATIDIYGMGYEAGVPEYFWDPTGVSGEDALERASVGINGQKGGHNIKLEARLREAFETLGLVTNH